jgi:hypothetical protein
MSLQPPLRIGEHAIHCEHDAPATNHGPLQRVVRPHAFIHGGKPFETSRTATTGELSASVHFASNSRDVIAIGAPHWRRRGSKRLKLIGKRPYGLLSGV